MCLNRGMTTKIPTEAEVQALRQAWAASSWLNLNNLNAYEAAKKAHEAGPDTQQILDDAIAARSKALAAVREARIAHAWATR
jgi:hypothetical protein